MRIKDSKLRRRIVDLVEQIAGEDGLDAAQAAQYARTPIHAHILTVG